MKTKIGYRDILKQKDFAKLLAANIVNRFGDSIDAIAFTWMVYILTDSAAWSAIIYGVNRIPTIFLQPVAGARVENGNKKAIMVGTDILRGICVAFIAVAYFMKLLQPWMLIITSLIISSAEAFRLPASSAVLVRILPKEKIDFGVSLNSSVSTATELIGTAIAGVIISLFGLSVAIGLDALTFAISALLLSTLSIKEQHTGQRNAGSHYTELLKEGCKYVLSEKTIFQFIVLAVMANAIFVPINSLQAPLVSEILKEDEKMLSILSIALAAGMMFSAVFYPYIAEKISVRPLIFLTGALFGIYYMSLVAIGSYVEYTAVKYVLVATSSFVSGFVVSLLSTYINATFLKVVKQEYIARTAAIMNSAASSAMPLVSFLVSIVAAKLSTAGIFIISGILLIIVMSIMSLVFENDGEKEAVNPQA